MTSVGLALTNLWGCCQHLWRKQSWEQFVAAGRAAQFGSAWSASSVSAQHRCLGEIIIRADAAAGSASVNSFLP